MTVLNFNADEYGLIDPTDAVINVLYAKNENDMSVYIVCLANTETTFHIFHQHEAFTDYRPIDNITISGVGGTKTHTKGKGTIQMISEINTRRQLIKLCDALHVPNSKHNLISLSRWEADSRSYHTTDGVLSLLSSDGTIVAKGERAKNNLYWMRFQLLQNTWPPPNQYVYASINQSWDTWHRRFSHISYGSLQTLCNKGMVSDLQIDPKSPKSNCIPCTEAKQAHCPFPSIAAHTTTIGHLTHIDL